jgi:glycine cleavage system T protein
MSQESPLTALHKTRKAEFVEEDGWILPLHFGNPLQEYEAVRLHAGLLDLCHRSLLRFKGSDRTSFLQGMVSNDVRALTPGAGIQAAILDVNGKILADLRVFCGEDFFLIDLWEFRRAEILEHLRHYLVAEDVEIDDLAGRYGILSLQGPKARSLLDRILSSQELPSRMHGHHTVLIENREVRVARSAHTGEDGVDLFLDVGDLPRVVSRIEEAGQSLPLRWVGVQALDILRLEAGIPRYGVDMDENNLLLETGLDHAVSFHKGCYLGQEVIERIHSRGHVNKKLAGLILEGEAPALRGDPICFDGKEIGKITSSRLSPAVKRPIALGYVHRDYLAAGIQVSIQHDGRAIQAEIASLPFYKPPTPLETPAGLS